MAGFTAVVRNIGKESIIITIPKTEKIRHNIQTGDYISIDFDKQTVEHIKNKKNKTTGNERRITGDIY